MKILYLDLGMGAAGDMLAGALLGLLDEKARAETLETLNAALPAGVAATCERAAQHGLAGWKFTVTVDGAEETPHPSPAAEETDCHGPSGLAMTGTGTHHVHRDLADIAGIVAGMGLDADMSWREDNAALKPLLSRLRLNRVGGLCAKAGAFFRAKPCRGYIILDGVKRVEFNNIYFVSAQLQPYECSGLRFAPYAVDSDGRLEVCVMSHSSRRDVGNMLLAARAGKTYLRGLRIYQCRDLEIHTEEPVMFHADGESTGERICDLSVGCIERKVRMIL